MMTYARARLYLGISGVGFWVLASALALLAGLPTTLFPNYDLDATETAGRLLIIVVGYIVLSLPFDLFGGYILPRRFNRSVPSGLPAYLVGWLRGVLVQGAVYFLVGMLFITAARQSGSVFLVIVLAGIIMLLQLMTQEWLARLAGGFAVSKPDLSGAEKLVKRWGLEMPDNVVAYAGKDEGFVGALAGLPGMERLVLPSAWLTALNEEALAAQIARRIGVIKRGSRERGVYLALIWNLVGLWIATSLAGPNAVDTSSGLLTTILYFNLWSFVGLLVLPSLSRGGVYEADIFARKAGVPHDAFDVLLPELDRRQDDEPARSRLIETIFHPIPSVSKRLERLNEKHARAFGWWHGARMALFLSWGCLGFLARAVHCNSGRPELWVMLPGD
jgi:Zn-dependent protease with chaperone function